MVVFLCLRWWYGAGWQWVLQSVLVNRSNWVLETFSTSDLLRTLFAPYRQTFAGKVKGSLEVRLRAFFDTLISRVIGFIVRFFLICMSLVGLMVVLVVAVCTLIIWPFIPLLPVIGFALMSMGVKL